MKIHLEKVIFNNRAPFDKLDLDFNENEVSVLTAVNGRGKTTIISHIVDAFHEMAKPNFQNEFQDKENKFYRVSSPIYNLDQTKPSFVYLRFKTDEGFIDFLDIRNKCTLAEYNEAISLDGKISFNEFNQILEESNFIKKVSSNFDKIKANKIFLNNILTFFPSYRYEKPGYLNEPYQINIDFKKQTEFAGYLHNPIEVVSSLQQIANWIMDVVLDLRSNNNPLEQILFQNLNTIISQTLVSKKLGNLRFGVGPRGYGSTRIQILNNNNSLYPSIFNLSSGESSLLCLFGEILRQGDKLITGAQLTQIKGIVLIDEIDKHLHIKLQKEVLPLLIHLFPNIQFILSSHSPFLNMGLAELIKSRSKIIDLDNLGISKDPTSNNLYQEVYNLMINENDRFKDQFLLLEQKIQENSIPLVITEGKTDVNHIRKAKNSLNIENVDFEFYEISGDWGDSKLKLLLEQLSKINQPRKIIGIFDRDVDQIVSEIERDNQLYKDFSNNVFGFCIPIPIGRETYSKISTEFYYSDAEIKKEKNGKSLFFDNEVDFLFNKSTNIPEIRKLENIRTENENSKKIFDEPKMCEVTNWIHSKANFANLIETDEDFSNEIDFSNFNLIFDRIALIINS